MFTCRHWKYVHSILFFSFPSRLCCHVFHNTGFGHSFYPLYTLIFGLRGSKSEQELMVWSTTIEPVENELKCRRLGVYREVWDDTIVKGVPETDGVPSPYRYERTNDMTTWRTEDRVLKGLLLHTLWTPLSSREFVFVRFLHPLNYWCPGGSWYLSSVYYLRKG